MQAGQLVTLIKEPELGIGCVSKLLKVSYRVNFGTAEVRTCKPTELRKVNTADVSKISFSEFRSRILKDKSTLNKCIVGNEVMEYVRIGWISRGVVTLKDLKEIPMVVEDSMVDA